jgi:hypothetical protein
MMAERLRLRAAGLEWRTVGGEVVALDMTDASYLAVNPSGKDLWEALAAGTTRAALVQLLIDQYALDHTTAEHDTEAFLGELGRHGLLDAGAQWSSDDEQPPEAQAARYR